MRWIAIALVLFGSLDLQPATILINHYRFGSSLNTSLIAYWKLDEASGTRADSEPTAPTHNLTDNNTVTSTTGVIGNAAFFVAANAESLSETDTADISVGDIDFAISCWVKITALGSMTAASQYDATGNQRSWRLGYNGANGRFEFTVSNDGSATRVAVADTFGAPATNVFYFLYGFHDSVNNLVGISVNNGALDTTSHTLGVFNSTADFSIGKDGAATRFWDGAIDGVAFWKKVLTATEVTALYNSGSGRTCCPF